MIDIHSHILPQIDDGSEDLEKSIGQLKLMEAGGIKELYLSSHYFRGHYQYSRAEYDAKLSALQVAAQANGIQIKLHSGFEVFVQPGIVDDIIEKKLTLGNSNYVLIESELNGLPIDFYQNVYPILRAGYRPILAHAERYVSIMKHPKKARELIDKDIYIQTNAGSLLGHYGEKVKHTAWTLVNNGWTHFLASDDHVRMDYGAYFAACKLVEERVDKRSRDLLCKEFPGAISKNEKVPFNYVMVRLSRQRSKRSFFGRIFG